MCRFKLFVILLKSIGRHEHGTLCLINGWERLRNWSCFESAVHFSVSSVHFTALHGCLAYQLLELFGLFTMAANNTVIVLAPNGHRQKVKVTPNTTILQVHKSQIQLKRFHLSPFFLFCFLSLNTTNNIYSNLLRLCYHVERFFNAYN